MKQKIKAYIEIEKSSNIKYEFDKEKKELIVDRILDKGFAYPYAYGFIPNTLGDDNDEVDVLIITDKELKHNMIYDAYIIGSLVMEDEKGMDEKIISVLEEDYEKVSDILDLDENIKNDIYNFFKDYKKNSIGKWSKVIGYINRDLSIKMYEKSILPYKVDYGEYIESLMCKKEKNDDINADLNNTINTYIEEKEECNFRNVSNDEIIEDIKIDDSINDYQLYSFDNSSTNDMFQEDEHDNYIENDNMSEISNDNFNNEIRSKATENSDLNNIVKEKIRDLLILNKSNDKTLNNLIEIINKVPIDILIDKLSNITNNIEETKIGEYIRENIEDINDNISNYGSDNNIKENINKLNGNINLNWKKKKNKKKNRR